MGLVLALVASLVAPQAGVWMAGPRTAFALIAVMFLINGYQTELHALAVNRRMVGAFLICGLVSFLGGSLLGKALVTLWDFGPEIATGILVMCTMAPTLSSVVVITRESGGNTAWAILMTVGLNLLSIFAIPALLAVTLSGTTVELPVLALLCDLILSVLVPFTVGMALRRWLRRAPSAAINQLPTLLVIMLSYMSFCSGRRTLVDSSVLALGLLMLSLLGVHGAMLLIATGISALAGHSQGERKAVAFLSSQKTLPTAVGILASIGQATGPAALPCVMFHFTQILCDSIIAAFWRARSPEALTPGQIEITKATAASAH